MAAFAALLRIAALILALGGAAGAQPVAERIAVDLELVLLADASGSIDAAEIRFQREGYATAITSAPVLDAIANTAYGSIAVTYVEWASAGTEAVVVPWMVIDGAESAQAFATALLPPPRRAYGRNAIGSALLTGKRLIEGNAIDGWRKVIDFSGDSANNWNGLPIAAARDEVLAAGITINGLAILCRFCNGRPGGADLERLYRDRIIGGPGAFVITADTDASFAAAVTRKLVQEISGIPAGPALAKVD